MDALEQRILDALPQTQCTRCGYPDCAGYAHAIAQGITAINQCPPGGAEGIARLAHITQKPIIPLNPDFGFEEPRSVMFIDENWCIGCTLCIKACPTDAIMGANKHMHTILEEHCTGCALCLPVCPVDCIVVENASGKATGWSAWSDKQASNARVRYEFSSYRRNLLAGEHAVLQEKRAEAKLADLPAHSQLTDPTVLDNKRAVIEAALARSRAKRAAQK
jgi:electron transport complex protein RnfB